MGGKENSRGMSRKGGGGGGEKEKKNWNTYPWEWENLVTCDKRISDAI